MDAFSRPLKSGTAEQPPDAEPNGSVIGLAWPRRDRREIEVDGKAKSLLIGLTPRTQKQNQKRPAAWRAGVPGQIGMLQHAPVSG
jgi:hypothetical protein